MIQPLTEKQRAAVDLSAEHAITVYEGAVRSSKTVTSLIDFLRMVRTAPAGKILVGGKTERTLRENIIGPLTDMLGARRCRYVQGAGVLHLLGRECIVVGAADERASEKIRGVTLVGAYVDELTILPESFWTMLLSRLSVAGGRVIATTNPGSPAHWLKKDYLDRARTHLTRTGHLVRDGRYDATNPNGPIDLARLSFVIADNVTLPISYVRRIESLYTGLWRRRFIDGDWVAAEGAIYDMLDLTPGGAHRIPWEQVRRRLTGRHWVGLDYGQSNPFHAVLLGTTDDDHLVVCGEWRYDGRTEHRQLDDGEYEQRLRGWLDAGADIPPVVDAHNNVFRTSSIWPEKTAVDPSAASFRSMLRNRGWTGLVAADNSVADGIRNTSSLLAARRLRFVDGAAPMLEREMLGYVWDPKATKKGEDEPLKVDDHGVDALRYGVQVTRSAWRPWLQRGLHSVAA